MKVLFNLIELFYNEIMIDDYINEKMIIIEKALEDYFVQPPKFATKVYESMKYTLFAKAKRIRPLIMIMIAETFRIDIRKILPFACAIEYVHTSSLILDDLPCMDDAKLRRGKAANHIVFGEGISILAAIALLNHAYCIIAKCSNSVENSKLLKILEILTAAISIEGLVGGQSIDLLSKEKKIQLEMLEYIHRSKTASLFIASAKISAILCDVNTIEENAIAHYAEFLGIAFQISDDLKDQLLTEKELEKDANKDVSSTTYLSYFDVEDTRRIICQLTDNAISELSILSYDAKLLVQLAEKLKKI